MPENFKRLIPEINLPWHVFLIITLFSFVSSLAAYAQYPGYNSISDLSSFKKKFATESAKVLSITSDFKQDKTLTALTETITSSGKFRFKRNNKVRIEYVKPFAYL